jgi:hypothetical protein
MISKSVSRWARRAAIAVCIGLMSLATFGTAQALCRRGGVVVHREVHRVVPRPYPPVVVRYVPAYHGACVVRSGYYYSPAFGYHTHCYHPSGIHFGVRLVF